MLDAKKRAVLDAIFLRTRKALEGWPSGPMKARIPSGGMDFLDLREYQPGDEVRHIDWKSTSRSGKVLVKKFIHDQEISVLIFASTSPSMNFSTITSTKLEVMTEIATALAWITINSGNRFSLYKFSKTAEYCIRNANNEKHVLAAGAILLGGQKPKTDKSVDIWKILSGKKTPRSMVFILSDFYEKLDPRLFSACAQKHDLHLFRILDKSEINLPDTPDIICKHPEKSQTHLMRSSEKEFRSNYQRLFNEHENQIIELCKSNETGFLRINTCEPYLAILVDYFNQLFHGQ